jgi:formate hydrogenlyase subunit 4
MNAVVGILLFVVLAPLAGGLLAGVDRRLTARIQRRIGPPILQPFYDVAKLMQKENLVVNASQHLYVIGFLLFTVVAGAIFFAGGDLLIAFFALVLGGIFLVLGAYSASSPYSHIGAERELLQLMACEPMLLIAVLGLYAADGSFHVSNLARASSPLIAHLPGIFFGVLFILTIKLRKSPFDLSTSHHAHQEIVKGLTTEFTGPALALIEIAHWYENILILGFVYLFLASHPFVALGVVALAYLLEIIVDNATARLRWQWTVRSCWLVAATAGAINLVWVYYWMRPGG